MADRLVNVEPVSAVTMLVLPVKVPASITYDVGPSADGFHDRVTVSPLKLNVKPFGALGGPLQGPLLLTTTTTSLEDPPVPMPFWPRTRTKRFASATGASIFTRIAPLPATSTTSTCCFSTRTA